MDDQTTQKHPSKTFTIRLPLNLFESLVSRAEAEKLTLADVIRRAAQAHVDGASNAQLMQRLNEVDAGLTAKLTDLQALATAD